jgi:toxin ParE1/3/4
VPARYRVEVTAAAEGDLESIWEWIASDSVANATRFLGDVESGIESLERMPGRCPSIPENEILGTDYRHLIIGNYRVIIRVTGSTVYILRVVHGNMLLDTSWPREE